jgi:hypothetical protein
MSFSGRLFIGHAAARVRRLGQHRLQTDQPDRLPADPGPGDIVHE